MCRQHGAEDGSGRVSSSDSPDTVRTVLGGKTSYEPEKTNPVL